MIFVASFSMYSSGYTTVVSRNERKVIFLINFLRPFQFQEKTKSGYKHNKGVFHGKLNLKLHFYYVSTYTLASDGCKIWQDLKRVQLKRGVGK